MMTKIRWTTAAAAVALTLGSAVDAHAQDPEPPAQPPAAEAELVFEREVFQYPTFTRRNPFRPLDAADEGGPRFESLSLIGIMYSSDPSASVAVVTTGGVEVAEDGTLSPVDGDAFNVKVGDRLGNATIREIRRDALIVDIEVFDAVEQHILTFVSRREGGTP